MPKTRFLTKADIQLWLNIQDEQSRFCPFCVAKLQQIKTSSTMYCPNDMCICDDLYDRTHMERED